MKQIKLNFGAKAEVKTNNTERPRILEVMDVKGRGLYSKYLVKWRSNGEIFCTWEQLGFFKQDEDELLKFRTNRLRRYVSSPNQFKKTEASLDRQKSKKLIVTKKEQAYNVKSKKSFNLEEITIESSDHLKKFDLDGSQTMLIEELTERLDLNRIEVEKKVEDNIMNVKEDTQGEYEEAKFKSPNSNIHSSSNCLDDSKILLKFALDILNSTERLKLSDYLANTEATTLDGFATALNAVSKAVGIKRHSIFKGKLCFQLSWKEKHMEIKYSDRLFSFKEVEQQNPVLLLRFLKSYILGSYIFI